MSEAHELEFKHPRLAQLYVLWNFKRNEREMPRLAEFAEADLADLRDNLLVVEVGNDPVRFRYLAVGPDLKKFVSFALEGRYVHEVRNPFFRLMALRAYNDVVARRVPAMSKYRFGHDFWFGSYERLLLPLSDDERTVTHVIGAIYPRFGALQEKLPERVPFRRA
jgi:hypothetical protein